VSLVGLRADVRDGEQLAPKHGWDTAQAESCFATFSVCRSPGVQTVHPAK